MTPSEQCKAAGLKSLAEVARISGVSEQTLINWHRNKPRLFAVCVAGAVARSISNAWLGGKWCYYCKKDTHNDVECWGTRPAGWKPAHVNAAPEIWVPTTENGMIATHEDSDGTGYCRVCGTTIGESHHNDCNLKEAKLEARRLEADKLRPNQCACGHSQAAHDSGYAFCWHCECNKFVPPSDRRERG